MDQRVVVSGTKSSWNPVTSRNQVLFNNLINNLGDGVEWTLSKITDDMKLGEMLDSPEGCEAI